MENCLICDQKGKKLFNAGKLELWKCQTCDLAWTKNFQEPDYKNYHLDQNYCNSSPLFRNIFKRILKISGQHIRKKGELFEVGASVGNLLEVFRENGWKVSGIEPSEAAREVALAKGLEVLPGKLESTKLKPNNYQLIVMNHTLEHVADPEMVLKKIHAVLKKDGSLIIGVPNFGSFSAQILRKRWPHILATEHKWHFSPQSLKLLLEKNNFTPLAHYTSSGIFEFDSPIGELVESLTTLKKRFFTNLATIPLAYLVTKMNKGTGLLVVAQKN